MERRLTIDMQKPPKVLFVGNGLLLLDNNGTGWAELLDSLNQDGRKIPGIKKIPSAMQPEAIRGTDVETVQSLTASMLKSRIPHDILKELVFLDFDAILTTNYTYEIEDALTGGRWSEYKRRKCHTTLFEDPHVRFNTYKCNLVRDIKGRDVPVFHVHGELARKHSLVLSYYSYADAVFHLIEMNKRRKNAYEEHQLSGTPLDCQGWLDYFIMGEVYTVGFGFDLSEFDIWWASERKSREHANNGKLHAYMISEKADKARSSMLSAMGIDEKYFRVKDGHFAEEYETVLEDIRSQLK